MRAKLADEAAPKLRLPSIALAAHPRLQQGGAVDDVVVEHVGDAGR